MLFPEDPKTIEAVHNPMMFVGGVIVERKFWKPVTVIRLVPVDEPECGHPDCPPVSHVVISSGWTRSGAMRKAIKRVGARVRTLSDKPTQNT